MSWSVETQVAVSQQMTAISTERRCPECSRKYAMSGGVCRWVALGKCDPQ